MDDALWFAWDLAGPDPALAARPSSCPQGAVAGSNVYRSALECCYHEHLLDDPCHTVPRDGRSYQTERKRLAWMMGTRNERETPWTWALGIFILALGTRLLFQAQFMGWNAPPRDDASQYDAIAWRLAQGQSYAAPDGYLSHRAPAYPILLSGVYLIFGHSWPAARAAQALLGGLTAVLLLVLGADLLSARVRVASALIYAVFPFSVYWSGFLLSEPLCVFLTVLATWGLFRTRSGTIGWAVWGLATGLATLTRPNMGLLLVLGLPFAGDRSRPRLRGWLVAAAVFLLTLLPWAVRNQRVHQRFVPVTTVGGVVLWESNNPHLLGDSEMMGRCSHAPDLPEARTVEGLSEVDQDQAYFHLALRSIATHWRSLPELLAYKMARLWNPAPSLPSRLQSAGATLSIVPLFLLFGTGLWLAWSRREPWLAPILIPIATVTLTGLVYWGDARIRSPADPSIMVVAAYALVSGGSLWRERLRRHGGRPESSPKVPA